MNKEKFDSEKREFDAIMLSYRWPAAAEGQEVRKKSAESLNDGNDGNKGLDSDLAIRSDVLPKHRSWPKWVRDLFDAA